jgi:hypothetical protein
MSDCVVVQEQKKRRRKKNPKTDLSLPRYSRLCFSSLYASKSDEMERQRIKYICASEILFYYHYFFVVPEYISRSKHACRKNFPYKQYRFTMRAICLAENGRREEEDGVDISTPHDTEKASS